MPFVPSHQALEAQAYERGESGLSIFLSKPFQRLLKYPLLFQNLLFHTDPSTFEFEVGLPLLSIKRRSFRSHLFANVPLQSTVAMVVEVERIVRSIEDEKVSTEERDKARDAFARIEGLTDKVCFCSTIWVSATHCLSKLCVDFSGRLETVLEPFTCRGDRPVRRKLPSRHLRELAYEGQYKPRRYQWQ